MPGAVGEAPPQVAGSSWGGQRWSEPLGVGL